MARFYPTDWQHYDACPRCRADLGRPCCDTRFRVRTRELDHVHPERPLTRPTTAVTTPPSTEVPAQPEEP